MTRRSFLKALVATGVVIASKEIFEDRLLKLEDYPSITYDKQRVPEKCTYLHTMQFKNKNGDLWQIAEYADIIDEEIINIMLEISIKAGLIA